MCKPNKPAIGHLSFKLSCLNTHAPIEHTYTNYTCWIGWNSVFIQPHQLWNFWKNLCCEGCKHHDMTLENLNAHSLFSARFHIMVVHWEVGLLVVSEVDCPVSGKTSHGLKVILMCLHSWSVHVNWKNWDIRSWHQWPALAPCTRLVSLVHRLFHR